MCLYGCLVMHERMDFTWCQVSILFELMCVLVRCALFVIFNIRDCFPNSLVFSHPHVDGQINLAF